MSRSLARLCGRIGSVSASHRASRRASDNPRTPSGKARPIEAIAPVARLTRAARAVHKREPTQTEFCASLAGTRATTPGEEGRTAETQSPGSVYYVLSTPSFPVSQSSSLALISVAFYKITARFRVLAALRVPASPHHQPDTRPPEEAEHDTHTHSDARLWTIGLARDRPDLPTRPFPSHPPLIDSRLHPQRRPARQPHADRRIRVRPDWPPVVLRLPRVPRPR